MSNFSLQPHRKYNITQYEELGFSQIIQMKDDYTTNSHYLTYTFLFKRLGECTFLNLGLFVSPLRTCGCSSITEHSCSFAPPTQTARHFWADLKTPRNNKQEKKRIGEQNVDKATPIGPWELNELVQDAKSMRDAVEKLTNIHWVTHLYILDI